MSEILYLSIPNGSETIELSSEILLDGYSKTEMLHNSLKPVDVSIKFEIPYDETIADSIITHADEYITAVIKDGNISVFTGVLRKNYTLSKTVRNQPLSLELVPYSFKLDKNIGVNVKKENQSVYQLIDYLLVTCGFYSESKAITDYAVSGAVNLLNKVYDIVIFNSDDNLYDTLTELCFEAGLVFNFSADGNFICYPLFENDVVYTQHFTDANMKEVVTLSKQENDNDGVSCKWQQKKFIEDALIFSDTQNGDESDKCKITVAAGDYLYGTETNYCNYDNDQGSVIWANTAELEVKGDIPLSDFTKENLGTKYSVSYKNNGSSDKVITQFDITGNAWIQVEGENLNKTGAGTSYKEYELKYLNSDADVNDLTGRLYNYLKYSDFSLVVKSFDNYAVGSYIDVTTAGIGTIKGRIITKKTVPGKAYEYKVEAVAEYEAVVTTKENNRKSNANANLASILSAVGARYSNHIITLYKRSTKQLTADDLPQYEAYYDFSTNTVTWAVSSNGWVIDYSELSGEGTDYITTATAFAKTNKDTIAADEWSYPVPRGENGINGYNTYTVQLFKRYASTPVKPSGTLTYKFSTNTLSGDLENWSLSVPEVDDDNNPCWEIHATALSTTDTDTISNWSAPAQILKESNLTIADVQELINNAAPAPVVSADVTFAGFAVDDNSVALCDQSVTSTIKVVQTDEELGFSWGDISLPAGFTYSVSGNAITIKVAEGTVVKSGSFIIPIIYRAWKNNVLYVNAETSGAEYISSGTVLGNYDDINDVPSAPDEDALINWVGATIETALSSTGTFEENEAYIFKNGLYQKSDVESYGYAVLQDKETVYNLGIGYSQVKGGRYRNGVSSLTVPMFTEGDAIVGDYFTWLGENTNTNLSETGTFLKGCVYKYSGIIWKLDDSLSHNADALNDVLTVADEELEANNSTVKAYFDKLVTNDIITDRLVAKQAFIDKLVANDAFINKIQSTEITIGKVSGLQEDLDAKVDEETIIEGGKIKTSLIDADAITADSVKTEDITSGSGTFTGLKADEGEFTNCKVSGSFVSNGGYRYNNVISFDAPINLNTVINTVLSKFPGYTGYIHCYCELQYLDGSTIYRCFGNVIKVNATDEQFTITGYGCYASNEMYKFNAGFTKSGLWITIGQTNLHEAEYTSLTIYY